VTRELEKAALSERGGTCELTLFEELEGTGRRLQGVRCEVRKEVIYRTGGTKGVEEWRKRVREEGAVGGSMAGSTAGWWPSDRDRFPPRFLLPPSLQTHNCIISRARLTSLFVFITVPLNIPSLLFLSPLSPFLSLPLHPFPSFSLSVFLHCLLTLRSPPSRFDPMRAFALTPLSSLLVHPIDRLVDRFSFFIIYSVSSRLFRTKKLLHARNSPPPSSFFVASLRCDALLSLAPFYHLRSISFSFSLIS